MAFAGFPAEGLAFLAGLEADNSRSYWTQHKAVYERALKAPMEELIAEVDERFRPLRMFRPNRDVRFAKDKSPYKTHVAAAVERAGGALYYVQVSSSGLMIGSGAYIMMSDQLARFRTALDSDAAGTGFVELVEHYGRTKGLRLSSGGETPLKTAPKGFPKDHPRIEFLRWKGAIAFQEFGDPAWLHTAKAKTKIEQGWAACDPLNEWLDRHVGPSELPPDERR